MAATTISLDFNGFLRKSNNAVIRKVSGVYVVYECTYDAQRKTVSLIKLIYIGQAENIKERIINHEKWPLWRKKCGFGRKICFSCASVSSPDRERGAAALIYRHKPPVNSDYINNFPFDETTMVLTGKTNLLTARFTILRKD